MELFIKVSVSHLQKHIYCTLRFNGRHSQYVKMLRGPKKGSINLLCDTLIEKPDPYVYQFYKKQ